MTCAIHSYRLDGRCFVCGHVNEAIRADQAEADARHREYAKAYAMTPPTLPPEIEAAIENDRRGLADSLASLRTAITSALAAARQREVLEWAAGVEEAIRDLVVAARDVESHSEEMTMRRRHVQAVEGLAAAQDAIRLAIAADKARAVEAERVRLWHAVLSDLRNVAGVDAAEGKPPVSEFNALLDGLRPVLSQADAERLVGDFNASPYDGSDDCPARAALLAALTGAGGGS